MVFPMRIKGYFMIAVAACATCSAPLHADEIVRRAQRHLASLGYYKGAMDGDAGSMTGAAIRRYQIACKLKVTGELNQQTLEHMGLNAAAPAPQYKGIRALFREGPLAREDTPKQVATLRHAQLKLAELGYYAGPHNGLPGNALTNAIKEWQAHNGLRENGLLDSPTLAGLGIFPTP